MIPLISKNIDILAMAIWGKNCNIWVWKNRKEKKYITEFRHVPKMFGCQSGIKEQMFHKPFWKRSTFQLQNHLKICIDQETVSDKLRGKKFKSRSGKSAKRKARSQPFKDYGVYGVTTTPAVLICICRRCITQKYLHWTGLECNQARDLKKQEYQRRMEKTPVRSWTFFSAK